MECDDNAYDPFNQAAIYFGNHIGLKMVIFNFLCNIEFQNAGTIRNSGII